MPIKPIAKALHEARSTLFQIALFHSILDTLVVLILLLLGCTLLSLPRWWALVAAGIYAVVHTRGNLREVDFRTIEAKFPELEEQLITVADNVREDNQIIEALNTEVLAKMKHIQSASFLNFPKLTRELLTMAVVSFIIIGAAAFHVKFLDIGDIAKQIRDFNPQEPFDINAELLQFEESQNLSEILGDPSIAELGKQQLDLQLNPLLSDVDIGKVRPPEDKTFQEVAPPQIRAQTDQSYEEDIPKQYQRIVKTYFKEITRS
ncbi:hypothetical protein C4580_00010 [Candidatus Woesearchaeota archaeon]|nr:MAG: hypothetical protein C4580_00010 [Candidatus Woesearchaeota archaeon]